MTKKTQKVEEMDYIPVPFHQEGDDPVRTLIKRLAVVVRRWSNEELSGRRQRPDPDREIEY